MPSKRNAEPLYYYRKPVYTEHSYRFTEVHVYTPSWGDLLTPIAKMIEGCTVGNYTTAEAADRMRAAFLRMQECNVSAVADGSLSTQVYYKWQHYREPSGCESEVTYCQAAVSLPEDPYRLDASYRLHARVAAAMLRADRHHQWHKPQALLAALKRLRATELYWHRPGDDRAWFVTYGSQP